LGRRRDGDTASALRVSARLGEEPDRARRVTREDVARASRLVSLGCDLADFERTGDPVDRWDDVPASFCSVGQSETTNSRGDHSLGRTGVTV
jgi:hypothetical protein